MLMKILSVVRRLNEIKFKNKNETKLMKNNKQILRFDILESTFIQM